MFKTEYRKSMTIKRKCERVGTNTNSPIIETLRRIATAKIQRMEAAVVAPATYEVNTDTQTIKITGEMDEGAGFLNGGEWLKVQSKNPIWTLGMDPCRGVIIKNKVNGKVVVGHVMNQGSQESVDKQINGMFRYLREDTKRKDYVDADSISIHIFPGRFSGTTTEMIKKTLERMADLSKKMKINEIGASAEEKDCFLFDPNSSKLYRFKQNGNIINGLNGTEVSEHQV